MGVLIKAKVDGFRRCGVVHRSHGTYHPDGFFTDAELDQLKREPQLLVTEQAESAVSTDQSELVQELGDTVANLEHSLEQARNGLRSASRDLIDALERQKQAPVLILDAVRVLEPADAAAQGVICIKEDDLAAIIRQSLTKPEAHTDGSTTLDNSGGPEAPPPSEAVPPVSAAPGADATVKADKPAGKRGAGDKKGNGE